MALEIKLNQKLGHSLVMTPQLRQAIKLLQLGRAEYLEMIEKELLENPALEDLRESSAALERLGGSAEGTFGAEQGGEESRGASEAATVGDGGDDSRVGDSSGLRTETFDATTGFDGLSDDSGAFRRLYRPTEEDEERPSLEATLSKPEGLANHLLWQLRISEVPADDQQIAAQIVGNLDRNGYLCATVEELAQSSGRSALDVERVLRIIQFLDPIGIAARDLRECLLIQLDQLGLNESLCYRIVQDHLPDLEHRRYEAIAKSLSTELEKVYGAIKQIQKLEPRPGRPFVDELPVYITPDIFVRRVGEDYVISMNESGMPKLRLNPRYRELLSNSDGRGSSDREYLQECLKSAAWLIKSVHQRQRTIFRVTESIVKFQREFLEKGVAFLKPMVLRDVAEDVGMHESTVSRVTTNKYVHTPQGVFELKFFFSSGIKGALGEVSSESVKQRIQELVDAEDPRRPLSDQALVEFLKAENIDIARRTVAKYREALNILSSSRRKKIF